MLGCKGAVGLELAVGGQHEQLAAADAAKTMGCDARRTEAMSVRESDAASRELMADMG